MSVAQALVLLGIAVAEKIIYQSVEKIFVLIWLCRILVAEFVAYLRCKLLVFLVTYNWFLSVKLNVI